MAQRSSKRQPVYSADTLALRYMAGLVLIALGVMMFLAVEMHMAGNVFEMMRQVCYGLTGGLAAFFPLLPVWAGVLVIWSSQRKAPARPFFFAVFAFLGLCAFVVLVTRIGSEEYLAMLTRMSDGSWGGVIHQGYFQSVKLRASGGTLGIILAFPFWSLVGTVLGGILVFLMILASILLALNLTPGRIRDLATGKVALRWGRKPVDQQEQDERQIAFQQEQERQRQMAFMQQQSYMQGQQAAAMAAQQSAGWQRTGRQTDPGRMTADDRNINPDIRDWQQQLAEQTAATGRNGNSRIFNSDMQVNRDGEAFSEAEKKPKRVSAIFGGRKQKEDGLSDLSAEEKRKAAAAWQGAGGQRTAPAARRTVSGNAIGPTATQWNAADTDEEVQRVYEEAARRNRQPVEHAASRAAVKENGTDGDGLDRWRRPETGEARRQADVPDGAEKTIGQEETEPWEEAEKQSRGAFSRRPEPVKEDRRPTTQREEKSAPGTGREAEEPDLKTDVSAARQVVQDERRPASPWMEQVRAAEKKAGEADGPGTAEEKEISAAAQKKAVSARAPVAQDMIANPVWKPDLKGVEPKKPEEKETYWEPTPYYAPPITDLKKPEISALDTGAEDEERSRRLEATLASFKVQTRVVHVTHGPAISRFELELAPGTKVGKVASLEKDIASGMQATSVRIEAPIPGKSLVGVEVPNPTRATVTLREILESPQMQNAKSILTVALGKDIAGTPIVCDLAKMPHMLIAGATGSGKSVCINTIINSLLFRAGPDEVKMILVDPKVVELQCYNGIPHLLLPVVNDPHKAAAALAWAVAEMMERYDRFAERGVRNLEGYNNILEDGEKPMPRIVIIIDELADLMMVCKKDVEEYICRLTQLARAAGIHLIVATQRPSVDVITGLIKANIPSRIAFKTASYVDSRTILDRNGSEQLLGMGDMLYLPTGSFAPTRVQGCFLSDQEVNQIAEHVRQANPSAYDPDILDKLEQLSRGTDDAPAADLIGGSADSGSGDAELFAQAVEIAIQDGQVSTSTLQRRLKVGYSRAGRLTDEMEARGIVSAKDGSKPRKCLITREEWLAIQASGEA